MRVRRTVLLILLFTAATASAESKYISDRLEITVRSGPGIEFRILRNLPTGTRVETLETEGGWSKIAVPGGQEGWVLNRYLADDIPASQKYETLKAKCEPLEEQISELQSTNLALQKENQTLSDELVSVRQELGATKEQFEELKAASADYISLENENKRLAKQLKQKNQRVEALETRISDAFISEALKWFLSGAGVLIIGVIIGARNKRKRTSLM